MKQSYEPPYQQIALELRRKIEAGELRPGDRVPSTRELARQWNVALATAAHALKTLASEGMVRGLPRVGTVVAATAKVGARHSEQELTRERIIDAAIQLADTEGISALSLRGVAAKLSSPVMSLYRHVESKGALLLQMIDTALGEERLPGVVPAGWRAQLEVAAELQWRTMRRHPWLARLMSLTRPNPLPNGLVYAEWILRALDGYGLDAATRMRLHVLLFGFIQGISVNLETEAEAASDTGMTDDQWMQTQSEQFTAIAERGEFPAFAAALRELRDGFELDFELLFRMGLTAILDGFAHIIDAKKGHQ
jgi:DNA-binding transcriptional regulator YhcF (GntR family)